MSEAEPVYGPFFGMVGATVSMTLCALGAEYGTAKAGSAVATASIVRPQDIIKNLLPIVMSGIIAIYGLVCSVLIANAIQSSAEGYTVYNGYLHLAAGLSVGVSGLGAGYSIGEAGAAGILASVHQPNVFMGITLILIFAEVLGLYGLIVALLLTTKE